MMTPEQLKIQRLVNHYNKHCTKTNSARNNELLEIVLSFSSEKHDFDLIEENGSIYMKLAALS